MTGYDILKEAVALEASAMDDDGVIKDATIIRPGVSANRNKYTPKVLRESAPIFEGLPAFFGHQRDSFQRSDPRNLAGRWSNCRYVENEGLKGDLSLFTTAKDGVQTAREAGDLCGVSISVAAQFKKVQEGGRTVREAVAFRSDRGNSSDIVVSPAAGGRLWESATDPWWTDETEDKPTMKHTIEQVMASAAAKRVLEAVVPAEERQGLTVDALSEKYPETAKAIEAILDSEAESAKTQETAPAAKPEEPARANETVQTPSPDVTEVRRLLEAAQIERSDAAVSARLRESKLPKQFVTQAEKLFHGRVVESAEVDAWVLETKQALDEITGSGKINLPGGSVAVGQDGTDKVSKAVEGMLWGQDIDGVARFRTFKQAFFTVSGKAYDPLMPADEILRETHLSFDTGSRAFETLLTSSWAEIWADAMHKAMMREFNRPDEQQWRAVTSDIVNLTDLRTQHRPKVGGFEIPPTVAENGTYQYAADPADEEESYTPTKRGHLYQLTWEAILNDDLRIIRSIPQRMGRSARIGVNRFVLDTLITANPTMGDSVALFHTNSALRGGDGVTAASGNLGSTAFSSAQLEVRRRNMAIRASYGHTSADGTKLDPGAIIPKVILVPVPLQKTAWLEANSLVQPTGGSAGQNNSTEPNFSLQFGYQVVVCPWWTDANNWYLCADPTLGPTVEVGFLNGREQPDIFTRDEFTKDAETYKLRFVYGGTVLEPLSLDGNVVSG